MTDREGVDMPNITESANPRRATRFQKRDNAPRLSPRDISKEVGEVVYAVLTSGGEIKIGWSRDLLRRKDAYGESRIMGFMPGTYEDEQAIHARLKPYRSHGLEYYLRVQPVLDEVNKMRAWGGLEPLAFAQKKAA